MSVDLSVSRPLRIASASYSLWEMKPLAPLEDLLSRKGFKTQAAGKNGTCQFSFAPSAHKRSEVASKGKIKGLEQSKRRTSCHSSYDPTSLLP